MVFPNNTKCVVTMICLTLCKAHSDLEKQILSKHNMYANRLFEPLKYFPFYVIDLHLWRFTE